MRETISMPRFPDDPAVQHVYAAVYVPEEYALVSYKGNCSKNFEPMAAYDNNKIAVINTPDINLLMHDLQQVENNLLVKWQDFPVDGVPYLFSVIQPNKENSELFVVKLNKISMINIVLFVVLAGCGFGLAYCSWRVRGIVVFGIIALYAVLAFAAPTLMFVVGVMSGVSWAIGLTIVIWVIWGFLRGWDKIKTVMTTPIPFKKTNAVNEQPTVVAEVVVAEEIKPATDSSKPDNTEGGSHA